MDPVLAEYLLTELTAVFATQDLKLTPVQDLHKRAATGQSSDFLGKSALLNRIADDGFKKHLWHQETPLVLMPSKKYSRATFRAENLPVVTNPPKAGEIYTARVRGTVKLSQPERDVLLRNEQLNLNRSLKGIQVKVECNIWFANNKTVVEYTIQVYQFHKNGTPKRLKVSRF
jgi:hypothetical protein